MGQPEAKRKVIAKKVAERKKKTKKSYIVLGKWDTIIFVILYGMDIIKDGI